MKNLIAQIRGGTIYPEITGMVRFHPMFEGYLVTATINNLPPFYRDEHTAISPFGFHIHDGTSCLEGDNNNPFPDAKSHLNLTNASHGQHTGDFPVLIADKNGFAYLSFYTDKFTDTDIIEKVIIIHESPDDYRTQPAGNSGRKIACGKIEIQKNNNFYF